jgi:hypothetical protein
MMRFYHVGNLLKGKVGGTDPIVIAYHPHLGHASLLITILAPLLCFGKPLYIFKF